MPSELGAEIREDRSVVRRRLERPTLEEIFRFAEREVINEPRRLHSPLRLRLELGDQGRGLRSGRSPRAVRNE